MKEKITQLTRNIILFLHANFVLAIAFTVIHAGATRIGLRGHETAAWLALAISIWRRKS